jgi:hypothetical protein
LEDEYGGFQDGKMHNFPALVSSAGSREMVWRVDQKGDGEHE